VLTNPEELTPEFSEYYGIEPSQAAQLMTTIGDLVYKDDGIYYSPEEGHFFSYFHKEFGARSGYDLNWKVEEHEQTEVNRIIKILKDLWGDEYVSDFFEGQTETNLEKLTKGEGGAWEDFLKQAWQEEMIQDNYLAQYKPGDYVYDKVEEYVKEKSFKSSNTTPDDLYAMSSNKELYDTFAEGGGRKKRRKRRKTKKSKSKRKSKRSSKKKKTKKK
jgi:hypothetical protein